MMPATANRDDWATPLAALVAERWLPIPGYEGHYSVSDLGRVYSHPSISRRRGHILKQSAEPKRGYLKVNLSRDGVVRTHMVHRLVSSAFLGPANGRQTLHWNDDPADNRLANLRYGTNSENVLDSVRNGNHGEAKRTHCPRGHEYTPENTQRIGNKRQCRECKRAWDRAHRAEKSAARRARRAA